MEVGTWVTCYSLFGYVNFMHCVTLGPWTLGLVLSSTEKKTLENWLFKMQALSCLVNFSDVDSFSGNSPIFSFHLFLMNEKNFLGLLFRSGDNDDCT